MDDALGMRGFECLGDLTPILDGRVDWNWTAEYLAFDQLQNQMVHVARLLQAVDRRDIGMIERRQHSRFSPEAGEPLGIIRECRWQRFYGDITTEARIVRPVHLA